MPQLILEYSSNVIETDKLQSLFRNFHALMAERLPTDIHTCKSRAIECETYLVGQCQSENAFIHVSLKVLPGRSQETLRAVGDEMMQMMAHHFSVSAKRLKLHMTMEISELQTYFKMVPECHDTEV